MLRILVRINLYMYIGGRDYVGRPIISLTQPEQNGVEDLMELTDQELLDMFAYFTSVPRCSLNAFNNDNSISYSLLMHYRPIIHIKYLAS